MDPDPKRSAMQFLADLRGRVAAAVAIVDNVEQAVEMQVGEEEPARTALEDLLQARAALYAAASRMQLNW